MEIFSPVFNYITDNSRKLSHKAITVSIFIITVILVDNLFGVTYYYNLNKKIETIKNLNSLVADSTTTKDEKVKFLKIKVDLINHSSIKEKITEFISNINDSDSNINSPTLNILQYLSANLLLILAWIAVDFIIIRSIIRNTSLHFAAATKTSIVIATVIIAVIAVLFNSFCYFLSSIIFKISTLIPVFYGNIYLNFLAYTLFNIVLYLLGSYDYQEKRFDFRFKKHNVTA